MDEYYSTRLNSGSYLFNLIDNNQSHDLTKNKLSQSNLSFVESTALNDNLNLSQSDINVDMLNLGSDIPKDVVGGSSFSKWVTLRPRYQDKIPRSVMKDIGDISVNLPDYLTDTVENNKNNNHNVHKSLLNCNDSMNSQDKYSTLIIGSNEYKVPQKKPFYKKQTTLNHFYFDVIQSTINNTDYDDISLNVDDDFKFVVNIPDVPTIEEMNKPRYRWHKETVLESNNSVINEDKENIKKDTNINKNHSTFDIDSVFSKLNEENFASLNPMEVMYHIDEWVKQAKRSREFDKNTSVLLQRSTQIILTLTTALQLVTKVVNFGGILSSSDFKYEAEYLAAAFKMFLVICSGICKCLVFFVLIMLPWIVY